MPKKNAEMLCVSREDAVALFKALDFKTAGRWNRKKLRSQLAGLAELIEDGFELEDEGLNDLLQAVVAAAKSETTIDVVEEKAEKDEDEPEDEEEEGVVAPVGNADEDEEEEEEPAEEEDELEEDEEEEEEEEEDEADEEEDELVEVKPKKEKGSKKGLKKGAVSAEKDKMGNKKGSQASDINMAVMKLAKEGGFTCKQITAMTHLPSARVAGHMAYLIKKGLVVKTDRGVHELVSK